MKDGKDSQTLDIFEIPAAHFCAPGECQYSREVAEGVSLMLIESGRRDRFDVAAELSRVSGKDVSKHMLDAYASPARVEHALPFWLAPVLEEVCHSHVLTNWLVDKRGGRVAYGKDALRGELGKLVMLKDQAMKDLNSRIKHIEALLGSE
ncbi:hypothetical protein JWZ98_06995 [Methylomonas sp. EFPC1]|uniref:hypothetical protein n=1 Tax=Methylomonas sp. EFPC1 TaxID=2812647 RepID=UPI001966D2A3|nr:hypothetical protein [Methylomonas sp. EFPC1]QSB02676.1 hypothetical protein JWZ98_06995 [Methylomonas sp. EFPC1]